VDPSSSRIEYLLTDPLASDRNGALVLELGENDMASYLAQERAAGRLTPPEIIAKARRVVEIVAAAHSGGYAWLDVKPSNFVLVLIGRGAVVLKGIDVETARPLNTELPSSFKTTVRYMSPELAMRRLLAHEEIYDDILVEGNMSNQEINAPTSSTAVAATETLKGKKKKIHSFN
jgi:serine/threonine protein kinase